MIKFENTQTCIKDEKLSRVLDNHLNNMLKKTIIYIANLLNDDEHLVFFMNKNNYQNFRNKITHPIIKKDEEKKEVIKNVLEKIYSNDYQELNGKEKYTLARSIEYGIKIEENAMEKLLIDEKNDKAIEWISKYKIKNDEFRKKIKLKINKKEIKDIRQNILKGTSEQYKNFIIDNTDPLLFFLEYPTALILVFKKNEYEMLMRIQPENW